MLVGGLAVVTVVLWVDVKVVPWVAVKVYRWDDPKDHCKLVWVLVAE